MAHVLHRCSFSPFSSESKELQPSEHCVLLRQAFNAAGPRGHKLSVFHEKEVTSSKSSEDFDALSIVRKAAEKVVESFKGDFSKLPTLSKQKVKPKVSVQASGPLANYLDAPLLDISRMHKEDNIQAIVSTPRPSLVLEEKDSRDQLRRAVEFHEMFSQAAKFISSLQKSASTQDQGSIIITLKNFASYFSLCSAAFEKEVTHFSEMAARKKMEVRLAAMDNFLNPSLRTTFMSADPLSVNLVTPEAARETVKAVKDLSDRVLEKAFKDPNLPMKAVRRKPTRPTLIKVPQKQGPPPATSRSTPLLARTSTLRALPRFPRRALQASVETPNTSTDLPTSRIPPFPRRTDKEEGRQETSPTAPREGLQPAKTALRMFQGAGYSCFKRPGWTHQHPHGPS